MRLIPAPALVIAATFGLATPLLAQSAPPANALPLSRIIATVEANNNVRNFTEIEWDDDGYWEVKFRNDRGTPQRLRIDPVTAQPWRRR